MGQYFKAVNLDKREYVCPWCLSGGAKLWEWAANSQGAIWCLLLRKSDEGGGGDFYGYRSGNSEGGPIVGPLSKIAGRWAGDRVCLVGDYDSSNVYQETRKMRIISRELAAEWNAFIELPDRKIEFRAGCSCGSSG